MGREMQLLSKRDIGAREALVCLELKWFICFSWFLISWDDYSFMNGLDPQLVLQQFHLNENGREERMEMQLLH